MKISNFHHASAFFHRVKDREKVAGGYQYTQKIINTYTLWSSDGGKPTLYRLFFGDPEGPHRHLKASAIKFPDT